MKASTLLLFILSFGMLTGCVGYVVGPTNAAGHTVQFGDVPAIFSGFIGDNGPGQNHAKGGQ